MQHSQSRAETCFSPAQVKTILSAAKSVSYQTGHGGPVLLDCLSVLLRGSGFQSLWDCFIFFRQNCVLAITSSEHAVSRHPGLQTERLDCRSIGVFMNTLNFSSTQTHLVLQPSWSMSRRRTKRRRITRRRRKWKQTMASRTTTVLWWPQVHGKHWLSLPSFPQPFSTSKPALSRAIETIKKVIY